MILKNHGKSKFKFSTDVVNGNPLQYSYLKNPMDRGARRTKFMGLQELDATLRLNHRHRPNI